MSALHILDSLCEVFLPIFYFATVAAYGFAFYRDDALCEKWKSKILVATVVLHALYIGLHTAEYGRCMVTTPFEIMSLVAFTIVATYWFIEHKTGARQTGLFAVGIAFLLVLASAVMMRDPSEPNALLKNFSVGLHISAATFGYGALAISAIYGALYLILYQDIKSGRFGISYKHFPSLESLSNLSLYATIVGFVFLTVAIVIGMSALPQTFKNFSYSDPKLIVTMINWFIYGAVLFAHFVLRTEGRRTMRLTLGGFLLALFSWTITNAFLSGFHKFY